MDKQIRHIDFERGRDPRDAMNIGDAEQRSYNIVKEKIIEILYDIMDDYKIDRNKLIIVEPYPTKENPSAIIATKFSFNIGVNEFYVIYSKRYRSFHAVHKRNSEVVDDIRHDVHPDSISEDLNIIYTKIRYWIWVNNIKINENLEEYVKELNVLIQESYHFERGKDPKDAMEIGLKNKRIFKTVTEAAEWAFAFPEICTEGQINNWTDTNIAGIYIRIFNWFRNNTRFEDETSWMKNTDAKNIILHLQELVSDERWRKKLQTIVNPGLKESLHFERGKDPRDAMNIGLKQKRIFRSVKEVIEWAYNFPEVCSDGIIEKWSEASKKENFYEKVIFNWLRDNIKFEDEKEKYANNDIRARATITKTLRLRSVINGLKSHIRWAKRHHLKESIHFERGIEPKDAMEIGNKKERIKNRLISSIKKLPFKFDNIKDSYAAPPDYTEISFSYKEKEFFFGATWPFEENYAYYVQWVIMDDVATAPNAHTIKDCLTALEEQCKIIDSLNESYRFERKQDPRKSMKVGHAPFETIRLGKILHFEKTEMELIEKIFGESFSNLYCLGERFLSLIGPDHFNYLQDLMERGEELYNSHHNIELNKEQPGYDAKIWFVKTEKGLIMKYSGHVEDDINNTYEIYISNLETLININLSDKEIELIKI